jgi:hypothetical protein
MTISNRVRLAAHHDDFVHLTPVHLPEETMEALVVGERRVARCSCCMRGSLDRTWLAVDRGDKTRNWTTENPFLTLNPERFTVKKERFTSPAIRHCFLSGFDHRVIPAHNLASPPPRGRASGAGAARRVNCGIPAQSRWPLLTLPGHTSVVRRSRRALTRTSNASHVRPSATPGAAQARRGRC